MATPGRQEREVEPRAPDDGAQPAPDDHVLDGEQRYELVEGRVSEVPPAKEPHGRAHFELGYLLRAHAASGYVGAVDMLTRYGYRSDFAPDAAIFAVERDPDTGARQLEELAFEIRSEQALAVVTKKVRIMSARGVRRVLCLDLPGERVLEWSRDADDWRELASDEHIEDRCLACPLEVAALLDTARGDAAVVKALQARHVPELDAIRVEGVEAGMLAARRADLEAILAGRGLTPTPAQRQRLAACRDAEQLATWLRRAALGHDLEGIFGA